MSATHSVMDLRRENRNRVYKCVCLKPNQTAQDIAQALHMSLPTVTQNLGELLNMGLIDNSQIADSRGGRRPRLWNPLTDARCAIGVELTPHNVFLVAVDIAINQLGYRIIDRAFSTDDAYASALAQDISRFAEETCLTRGQILGVGIALPGIVNADETQLMYATTLSDENIALAYLKRAIALPLRCFNDANAGGFAEWWLQTDVKHAAYLSLGHGVGGAILTNGAPYEGEHQRSGEFGHMCIHPGGRKCACGRRGCLEAYCSTALLSSELGLTLEEFFAQLDSGDAQKAEIFDRYLTDLALGMTNIHMALDCDVILGGPLSWFLEPWLAVIGRKLREADPVTEDCGYFRLSRNNGKANGIGAATILIDEFARNV